MPSYLPPLTRRQFLASAAATTAGWVLIRPDVLAGGNEDVDENYFVLLADTHIPTDPDSTARGDNMTDNLKLAVQRIVQHRPLPAGVVINGDCSHDVGHIAEYELLKNTLSPLAAAGIPVYLTMGNHDNRDHFYKVFDTAQSPLAESHVMIIEAPRARLFLLDSLIEPGHTPGKLGEEQREWLDKALAAHDDKPVILFEHHYPEGDRYGYFSLGNGLLDIDQLMEVAAPHPHVQALLYGHHHRWDVGKRFDEVHFVHQPSTGYLFNQDEPLAYLHAHLYEDRATLQLECLDQTDERQGEQHVMPYRLNEPQVGLWHSYRRHGEVGLLGLRMHADGSFIEPRQGGVQRVVITFSEPISLGDDPVELIHLAGASSEQEVALNVEVEGSQLLVSFNSELADASRWKLRLKPDAIHHKDNPMFTLPESSGNERSFGVLMGDHDGDGQVTDADLQSMWQVRPFDPANEGSIRADVRTRGRIGGADLNLTRSHAGSSLPD